MIPEMIIVRERLREVLKGQPKEMNEIVETAVMIGHAEFLSELCQWGAKEALNKRNINHFTVIAFASEQEKKLKEELKKVGEKYA